MSDVVDFSDLATRLRGSIVLPNHAEYDSVRALYNAMVDKRPAAIARCVDVPDVLAAVHFGRQAGLRIAIRGGGHNAAGLGSCDDGLLIDMSLMRGVEVDPATGLVRVQGGCVQGDVDHATHAFGLAVPLGIMSTTGVAGLTLGGGTGFLSRQHGLTVDNLRSADVVLASGTFVTADDSQNSDLFWALRGGGGNFGVVTSMTFQAHPVREVYAGPIFWDLRHLDQVMTWYREFIARAPRTLNVVPVVKTIGRAAIFPPEHRGKTACGMVICFNGNRFDGEQELQDLRSGLPPPLLDLVDTMPFPAMQMMSDSALPKGLQWFWKGDFVSELSDAAIAIHSEFANRLPSELSLMHLYPIDGAVHDIASGASAWGHRDAKWSMVIAGIDADPPKPVPSPDGRRTTGRPCIPSIPAEATSIL